MTSNQNQILICLGAGPSQVPVIRTAKQMGYDVVGIDRNLDAPGVRIVDEFLNISTYETDQVIRGLQTFKKHWFAGVLARTSGPALHTAAAISEKFLLPGLTREIIPLATEKSSLREFCWRNRLPIASGVRVKFHSEINGQVVPPVIVKPDLPLVGKKAVRVLWDFADLAPAVADASRASGNGFVEVADYIEGFDGACLFWAHRGSADILTYWDELVAVRNDGRICGLGVSVPSVIESTGCQKEVERMVKDFCRHFQDVNALLILAFRIDRQGRPSIIELHADLGGDLIADELFPAADSRFDYFRLCVEIATASAGEITRPTFQPSAILYLNECLKNGFQQKQFARYHAQNLDALHALIGGAIDGRFLCSGKVSQHRAFQRNSRSTFEMAE
ncbi:MAG: hypothetical protein ACE5G1_08595 [bacterium]